MYTGNDSVYTYTFKHEANPECPVCGGETLVITRPKDTLLQQVLDFLAEEPKVYGRILNQQGLRETDVYPLIHVDSLKPPRSCLVQE